mmetsp:Transcript_1099/g.1690  ORF Transcript_1099/g.1690 Transcript_1099/m.1690 type:complete len:255 (-) Transcript_1099:318-1082(-)
MLFSVCITFGRNLFPRIRCRPLFDSIDIPSSSGLVSSCPKSSKNIVGFSSFSEVVVSRKLLPLTSFLKRSSASKLSSSFSTVSRDSNDLPAGRKSVICRFCDVDIPSEFVAQIAVNLSIVLNSELHEVAVACSDSSWWPFSLLAYTSFSPHTTERRGESLVERSSRQMVASCSLSCLGEPQPADDGETSSTSVHLDLLTSDSLTVATFLRNVPEVCFKLLLVGTTETIPSKSVSIDSRGLSSVMDSNASPNLSD